MIQNTYKECAILPLSITQLWLIVFWDFLAFFYKKAMVIYLGFQKFCIVLTHLIYKSLYILDTHLTH